MRTAFSILVSRVPPLINELSEKHCFLRLVTGTKQRQTRFTTNQSIHGSEPTHRAQKNARSSLQQTSLGLDLLHHIRHSLAVPWRFHRQLRPDCWGLYASSNVPLSPGRSDVTPSFGSVLDEIDSTSHDTSEGSVRVGLTFSGCVASVESSCPRPLSSVINHESGPDRAVFATSPWDLCLCGARQWYGHYWRNRVGASNSFSSTRLLRWSSMVLVAGVCAWLVQRFARTPHCFVTILLVHDCCSLVSTSLRRRGQSDCDPDRGSSWGYNRQSSRRHAFEAP